MYRCTSTALPTIEWAAFFYRYRRDVLGVDEAEARAEMEEIWHPTGVWAAFVSPERGSGI